MARRHRHEEHENHEAWAIPYGDLVTLLLAFFVVMYAISTVNEGKYRAVSDSLSAAFKGPERSPNAIQIGNRAATNIKGDAGLVASNKLLGANLSVLKDVAGEVPVENLSKGMSRMDEIVSQIEAAMAEQIENQTLRVRRNGSNVEIEIRTDTLFPSGSASMAPASVPIMETLADTLKALPYAMRVEGHTDNRPINTTLFPSNWELSAARAATVVHLFTQRGVDPSNLAVIGLGEFRPEEDNGTDVGRAANRRVRVIILSQGDSPEVEQQLKGINEALAQQSIVQSSGIPVVTGPATNPEATSKATTGMQAPSATVSITPAVSGTMPSLERQLPR